MNHWIAVASADHVGTAVDEGFMQVSHGDRWALGRVRPGDGIAYYSPTLTMGGADKLQAFTAMGRILNRPAYAVEADPGTMTRRDVAWWPGRPAAIHPLLDELDLTRGRSHWGAVFRFGLVQVSAEDFALIARAMGLRLPVPLLA